MSARLAITLRAFAQLEAAHDWWLANRPAAPGLFERELGALLPRVVEHPRSGRPYPHPRVRGVRRVLMRRTRYHVFYRYQQRTDTVLILAVWGAQRGGPPPLGGRDGAE